MFSIITPAYNAAKYLRESIESVLKQTIPDWELILIIDEKSTDNTLGIANEYAAKDARIRVISVPHCTQAEKMNIGVRVAHYDWVSFLDADDIAFPERLAKQRAAIESHPEVLAWSAYGHYINDKGVLLHIGDLGPTTEEEFHDLRRRHQLVMGIHSTFTAQKAWMLKLGGYNPELYTVADLDFMDRLSDHGLLQTLPEPLVYYRIHSSSMTMSGYARHAFQIRYVWDRRAAQAEGKTLTFTEYAEIQATLSPIERTRQWASDWGRFYWTQAGIAYGEKHYMKMLRDLLVSSALSPTFLVKKVTGQLRHRLGMGDEPDTPAAADPATDHL